MKDLIEKAIEEYFLSKEKLIIPQLSNPVLESRIRAKLSIELIDGFIKVLETLKSACDENKTNG
jgi:hypothetical protein